MEPTLTILQIIAAAAVIQTGLALKCYECNSRQDPRCDDPFNGTASGLKMVECRRSDEGQKQEIEKVAVFMTKLGQSPPVAAPGEMTSAAPKNDSSTMSCQKLEINVMGEMVVGRGCVESFKARMDPCESVKLIMTDNIVLKWCSLCDTEGCNAGPSFSPTVLLLLPLALLPLLRFT